MGSLQRLLCLSNPLRHSLPGVALATSLFALPVWAQDQETVEFRGVVVDRATGTPIMGAHVQILGKGAYTDKDGRVRIGGLAPGVHSVVASHFGYTTYAEMQMFESDGAPVRVELAPNPVVLESIQVVVDRMKRRRNALPFAVRAYDEIQLRVARDAYDFVRSRFPIVRCPNSSMMQDCVWRRGSSVAPQIYVDEMPHFGGLDLLSSYLTSELHTIEVFNSGTQIRVYTKRFAERLASGRAHLMPILIF